MLSFFSLYFSLLKDVFSKQYVPYHIAAIFLTAALVLSGIDWWYLVLVATHLSPTLLHMLDTLGFMLPFILPLGLFLTYVKTKKLFYKVASKATVLAVLLGFSISMALKSITGRTSPPHRHHGEELILIDNSRAFNFGFMNEQIIGGWPSSHTTIAFALATTLSGLLPKQKFIQLCCFLVALSIGLGVTIGYHWLSEFVAGALLGIVTGRVVSAYAHTTLPN